MAKTNTISANSKPTSSIKLAAEIGTEMQVEITQLSSRIKLVMIGIVPSQYLLFQIPEKHTSSNTLAAITENSTINVRCISRGVAFGFNSEILGITTSPDTLLFAKYPEKIQQQSIRKNQRVKCLLPAKLHHDEVSINGSIADLSSSGCHFQTIKSELSADQTTILQPDSLIKVLFYLPAVDDEKSISAQIKNTFADYNKAQIGIEFLDINPETKNFIEEFVNMSFDLPPF